MTVTIIALLVFVATLLGGFFALRFKDKFHLIAGFSAGAVLGIAFIDLIPESAELIGDGHQASIITLSAVLFYIVLDRVFFKHTHDHHDEETINSEIKHEHRGRGIVRATSLVMHSFLDGLAVGFSFQVSPATGAIVAIAVLAHNFSDGINTVVAILKGGSSRQAKFWLGLNAVSPVLGIIVGSMISVSEFALGVIISIFAGFFVYIALADMIPESFHAHPKKWTTISTVLGALFIFIIIKLAGH
jgi:ZIP family zinc transporter